tara:strand:+ start:730 stop:1155 length:426 start_codon:yes stop_codon:yes gene_type:complete
MADEKAFDMTTKNRDTSRGPQNLQALRDMARRVLEAVKETGVNLYEIDGPSLIDGLIEGMPAPTAPEEYRNMRSPEEEEAYQEDVRREEAALRAAEAVPMAPPDPPDTGFPPPEALDNVTMGDEPSPSRRNKKSIDNPYGG